MHLSVLHNSLKTLRYLVQKFPLCTRSREGISVVEMIERGKSKEMKDILIQKRVSEGVEMK